jgi:hypothetical protein
VEFVEISRKRGLTLQPRYGESCGHGFRGLYFAACQWLGFGGWHASTIGFRLDSSPSSIEVKHEYQYEQLTARVVRKLKDSGHNSILPMFFILVFTTPAQ